MEKTKKELKTQKIVLIIAIIISILIVNITDIADIKTTESLEEIGIITDILEYKRSSGFLSTTSSCLLEINNATRITLNGNICIGIQTKEILYKKINNASSFLFGDDITIYYLTSKTKITVKNT